MVFLDDTFGVMVQGTREEVYGLRTGENTFEKTVGAVATMATISYLVYGLVKTSVVYHWNGFFRR